MPQPAAQPPRPEHKSSQPAADPPPSGPDSAPPKPAEEGGLFRVLVESGCDPTVAYTVEKRIHTMTSEIADGRLRRVLAELRQLRENMVTTADLDKTEGRLQREIADRDARLLKWMFGALMAQAALIIAIIGLLG